MNVLIDNTYIVEKLIGEGAHGKIFLAKHRFMCEEVVIKIDNSILLKNEAKIYQILSKEKGVPRLRRFGTEGDYNYLVTDCLGDSLDTCREKCRFKKMTLKSVICVGLQILRRLEMLHSNNLVHRDIKPENFLMGREKKDQDVVYMIDFGLSKLYKINNQIVENKKDKIPIGTIDYISLNVHRGMTPSRRDDLESVGYMLVYLLCGTLPWIKKTPSCDNISEEEIYKIKASCQLWDVCNDIPGEFILFIQYCRRLDYSENPNYIYLGQLLMNLFNLKNYSVDHPFCWNTYGEEGTQNNGENRCSVL